MAKQFDPKRILRQISNHLIRALFEARGYQLDIPWDDLRETEIDVVFNAWQELDEEDRRSIEIVLQEVKDLAADETGVRAIVEEAINLGQEQLVTELDDFESRHDKAVWTHIQSPDVWDLAVRFARADSLARGRYWITRMDFPKVAPDTCDDTIAEMEDVLSAYYLATQARGRHSKVEHYQRASGADYFFCYLDDYADTYINFDDSGEYARTPERRAFELVFAFDRECGTLDMFVKGGKKVYVPLQEIFARVILDEEIGPENRDSHPYELNGLLDRTFQFSTDPIDGVDSVRVRKLRLSVKGMPRRRITLESDPQSESDDIYDMIDEYLDNQRLPSTIMNVTQAGLKFEFDPDREDLPKSLSFDVSWPNSSNLKSKPEIVREIGEKYLKEWGLDRAASRQNDQHVT